MGANYSEVQELLQRRADYQARLNLMPYDGNPVIKEQSGAKYLYIRKRVAGKLTSTYVDVFSEELYQMLLRNARESKELKKAIRKITKELIELGYEDQCYFSRLFTKMMGETPSAFRNRAVHFDEKKHIEYTGVSNERIKSNLRYLANKIDKEKITIPKYSGIIKYE